MSQGSGRIAVVVIERNPQLDQLALSLSAQAAQSGAEVGEGNSAEMRRKTKKRRGSQVSSGSLEVTSYADAEQTAARAKKKRMQQVGNSETTEAPGVSGVSTDAEQAFESKRKRKNRNVSSGTVVAAFTDSEQGDAEAEQKQRKQLNRGLETTESNQPVTSARVSSSSSSVLFEKHTVPKKSSEKHTKQNSSHPEGDSANTASNLASKTDDLSICDPRSPVSANETATEEQSTTEDLRVISETTVSPGKEVPLSELGTSQIIKNDSSNPSELSHSSSSERSLAKRKDCQMHSITTDTKSVSKKPGKSPRLNYLTQTQSGHTHKPGASKSESDETSKVSLNYSNAALGANRCPIIVLLRDPKLDQQARDDSLDLLKDKTSEKPIVSSKPQCENSTENFYVEQQTAISDKSRKVTSNNVTMKQGVRMTDQSTESHQCKSDEIRDYERGNFKSPSTSVKDNLPAEDQSFEEDSDMRSKPSDSRLPNENVQSAQSELDNVFCFSLDDADQEDIDYDLLSENSTDIRPSNRASQDLTSKNQIASLEEPGNDRSPQATDSLAKAKPGSHQSAGNSSSLISVKDSNNAPDAIELTENTGEPTDKLIIHHQPANDEEPTEEDNSQHLPVQDAAPPCNKAPNRDGSPQPVDTLTKSKCDYQPRENPFRKKIPKKSGENSTSKRDIQSNKTFNCQNDCVPLPSGKSTPICEERSVSKDQQQSEAINRPTGSEAGPSRPHKTMRQPDDAVKQRATKEILCILNELLNAGALTEKNRSFDKQKVMQRIELSCLDKVELSSNDSTDILETAFSQFGAEMFCKIESSLIEIEKLDLECLKDRCFSLKYMPRDLVDRIVELAFVKRACFRLSIPEELDQVTTTLWQLFSLLGKKMDFLACLNQIERIPPSIYSEHRLPESLISSIASVLRENRQYFFLYVHDSFLGSLRDRLNSSLLEIKRSVPADVFTRSLSVAICRHIRWITHPMRSLKRLNSTDNLVQRIKFICSAFGVEYPRTEMRILEVIVQAQRLVLDSHSIFAAFRPFISCQWTINKIKTLLHGGIKACDLESCLSRLYKVNIENPRAEDIGSLTEFPSHVLSGAVDIYFNEFLREKSVDFNDDGRLQIQPLQVVQKMRNFCCELQIEFPHGSVAPMIDRIALRLIGQKFGFPKEKLIEVREACNIIKLLALRSDRVSFKPFNVTVNGFPDSTIPICSAFCAQLQFNHLKNSIDQSKMDSELKLAIDSAVQQSKISMPEVKKLLTIVAKLCAKKYMGHLQHHRLQKELVESFSIISHRFKLLCQQAGAAFPSEIFAELERIVCIRKLAIKADLPEFLVASLDSNIDLELALRQYSRFVALKKSSKVSDIVEVKMQPISNLQEIIACASMKAARTSRFRQSKLVADSASSSRPMYANYMDRSMSKNSSSEPSETTVRAASTDLENQALNNSSEDQSFSESRLSVSLILDDPFLQTEDVPCGVINSLDELPAPGNSVCELWGTSFASHGVSEGKIYFETVLLHAKEQPSQRSAFRVGWSLVPRSNFCAANHGLPGSSKFSFAYSSKGYAILAGSLSRLPGLECAVGDRVAITIEIKKTDCNEALAIFNVAVASSPSGRHLARQSCPFSIRYQLPANIIDMVWVPHVAVVNSKLQLCFNKISSTLVRPSDNLSLAFNTAVPIAQFKPPEQPEVLFNVGLPLSGKTRFTEAQKSVHKDSQLMVVSLDLFFERLIAPELDESLSNEETLNRLFDYLQIAGNDLIHTCLTHATKMRSNIIIDFCNLSYGTRRNRVELCGPGYETKAIIFCPGAKMTKRMIKSGLASRNQSQLSNAYNYLKAVMELPGLHNAEFDNVSLFGSGVTEEVVLARAAEIRSEAEAMGSFPGDCDEFLMELYCRFGLDVPDFAAEVDLTELGPQLNEAEFQPSMLQPLRNDRPDMLAQEAEPDLLLHGQMDYDEQFDFVPRVAAYGHPDPMAEPESPVFPPQ